MSAAVVQQLEARLARVPEPGSFSEADLAGLPDPVRRYFRRSIAPGTPLARSVRLRMRGSIKLGRRWIPFRARQTYGPHEGLVWAARAAGVIVGSDRYADGTGGMDWRLLGLIRLVHADGPDISRSSAGRTGAEAVWLPTAMLPRFGVAWSATDDHHVTARYRIDDTELELRFTLDDDARVRSIALERWGDADETGTSSLHPFGHEAIRYSTFDGITIPSAGRAGWHYGTDRWNEGEFFRYELTEFHLVT